jgi:hypothetical protein
MVAYETGPYGEWCKGSGRKNKKQKGKNQGPPCLAIVSWTW